MIEFLKKHALPILLVIGGIIDQTTDLLVGILEDLNAPDWSAKLLRVTIIAFGAIRLYFSTSPNQSQITGVGGSNPPPNKDEK